MGVTHAEHSVVQAQVALGVTFPRRYRRYLLRPGGTSLHLGDEAWWLFPLQVPRARGASRDAHGDLVSMNQQAHGWARFPAGAVAIGGNHGGDYLVLQSSHPAGTLETIPRIWRHRTGDCTRIDADLDELLAS